MTTIQHKRATLARWLEVDPVLADGEIGLETDTLKIKFGNGTSTWSSLSYFSGSAGATGTVTSVGITVPTGLTVSGSPVTTGGTIAISFDTGYSIPTTASQTNWDAGYTDRLKWDGGSTGLVAATGRTSLGATTVGSNLFTLTNPSAITFLRVNADNTVSALDASTFLSAISASSSTHTHGNLSNAGALSTSVTATSPVKVVITDSSNAIGTLTTTGASSSTYLRGDGTWVTPTGFSNPMTTAGDIIYGGASGVATRLAAGTSGQVLSSNGSGSAPSWINVSSGGLTASSYLTVGYLSADQTVTSGADVSPSFVSSSDPQSWWNATTKRFTPTTAGYYNINYFVSWKTGVTTNNQINVQIQKNGSTAALFQDPINTATGTAHSMGGSKIVYLNGSTDYINFTLYTANTTSQVVTGTADGAWTHFSAALITSGANITSNGLTISSPLSGGSFNGSTPITIALSSAYGDTQNPYGTKTANTVLAGPTTGSAAAPTFRSLVSSDIPSLTATYLALAGGTMTGALNLRKSGTTSGTAPLYFDSTSTGSNILTSAAAGAIEYDGSAFYGTVRAPASGAVGRGVIGTSFYYTTAASTTLVNNSSAQSIWGLTNGIQLVAGGVYEVEVYAAGTCGSTSAALQFQPLIWDQSTTYGTASLFVTAYKGSAPATAESRMVTSSSTASNITSASTATTWALSAKGKLYASTTMWFNPLVGFSVATGTAPVTNSASFVKVTMIGTTQAFNVGGWS